MPFDTDAAFTAPQLTALIHGMLSTARIDGLHPQEESLIRAFYDAQREAAMPAYEAVAAGAGGAMPADLAAEAGFAEQLVLMCLMAGYADGRLSEGERKHVAGIAQQIGIGAERLAELHLQVKDSLIGSLAHLPDAESVAALAKEFGA
jgi:hypothetical protein